MKKKLVTFTALIGILLSFSSLGMEKAGDEQIIIYSNPNSQSILEKLPGDAALIPIYQDKGWIKVGDPRNGHVGWVNKKQVRKARESFYRPDIQTIYIHSDESANGKPLLNIVAYRNGEKLSPKQAKRLYVRMRKQQMEEMKHMRRVFRREMMSMREAFQMSPLFQPMIVLPEPPLQHLKQPKQHSSQSNKKTELES